MYVSPSLSLSVGQRDGLNTCTPGLVIIMVPVYLAAGRQPSF